MATFLLKTEPEDYSFDDLVRDGRTVWDGLSNPAACKFLRGAKKGDEALIYHTGNEKRIAGLARIVADAYPDPNDPSTTAAGETKFPVVDLEPVQPATKRATLADIKADDRFAEFALVTQPRLGAMEVPKALDRALRKMAGL